MMNLKEVIIKNILNENKRLNDANIQLQEKRSIKIVHMSKLLGLYPNFEFFNNNGDVLVDALGDVSIQSSY